MSQLRRLTKDDLPRLREFWVEHWSGEEMIVHGDVIRYNQVEGFVFGDWRGLLTYILRGNECEIISFDSIEEGKGIGTALINEVIHEARQRKCARLSVTTTNANLQAFGFYQRRGFKLTSIHPGVVEEARKIKPSIPLIGENNIPLRDEIELEMIL